MQLLIFTPTISPRVKYIFNFLFRDVLRCDFEFTSLAATFTTYQGPKFSYANSPLDNELFFKADELLSKIGVVPIDFKFADFGDDRVPFRVEEGALPFDIFAASFYFLTRYEEYLPYQADNHNRFPARLSLQFELNLLERPIIDEWALILKNLLIKRLPSIQFGARQFNFVPTVDIDRAFHFKKSGLLKNAARILFAAYKRDTEKLKNIIATGLNKRPDPYDTFEKLSSLHQRYKVKPIFFFLLAHKGDREYDVNVHPEEKLLTKLIVEIAKNADLGIHPSYASNHTIAKLKEEKDHLEAVLNKKVVASRQHYLKIQLPKTYLELSAAGIYHDYTMGYASQIGFRAGTCTPFFWYDLQLEKQSHLTVHPFALMDVTLQQYTKLNPAEAVQTIERLIERVKIVNGTFYSLWHNESLSETGVWKNWSQVYEKLLIVATSS